MFKSTISLFTGKTVKQSVKYEVGVQVSQAVKTFSRLKLGLFNNHSEKKKKKYAPCVDLNEI